MVLFGHHSDFVRKAFHDILLFDQFAINLFSHGSEGSLKVGLHDFELLLDPFDILWSHALFLLSSDILVDFVDRGLLLVGIVDDLLKTSGNG